MQIHEEIKVMRMFRNWTQEELAEKLGWSVNGYAKIERGETDIKFDKLRAIADVMGVDLSVLLASSDGALFNLAENCHYNLPQGTILLSESQCAHELDKARLIIVQKDEEIRLLKDKIGAMEEIINLLRKTG